VWISISEQADRETGKRIRAMDETSKLAEQIKTDAVAG
jgi:hypothetical protein